MGCLGFISWMLVGTLVRPCAGTTNIPTLCAVSREAAPSATASGGPFVNSTSPTQENQPQANPGYSVKKPQEKGFPIFSVLFTGGVATTGLGDDDRKYYEGFSSGNTGRLAVRFFWPLTDRQAARVFFEFGLAYTKIGVDDESRYMLVGETVDYQPIYGELSDLKVYSGSLSVGITTSTLGDESYLFCLMGVSQLHHKIPTRLVLGDLQVPISNWTDYTDDKTSLHIEFGGVMGITRRVGINIDLGGEFLPGGSRDDYFSGSYPSTNGGILFVQTGLSVDL